ncbi:MAG TPA: cytochrome-c oxidase, cbb3-type subunit II, partial [Alphaproteobacteria bacterium]|nr:cytochrome-c oxidase, cbb3-type subunit II [Alphaproteobacteria bacterium]
DPDADHDELLARYPNTPIADFDGNPAMISELDAMIAYLQMLGTLVDFDVYKAEENYR